jgi:hypothetical protein
MAEYDWSRFKLRISINTTGRNIYEAWARPDNLERWFLRSALLFDAKGEAKTKDSHLANGDTYKWLWHGHPDTEVENGKIIEANGVDTLKFTFSGCQVTVTIKVEDGEVLTELVQENITVDETSKAKTHIICLTGWTFYLANLKSVLEGGKDLRNKNMQLKNVVNS